MMAHVTEFLNETKVGARQAHSNMTLYCLLSADNTTGFPNPGHPTGFRRGAGISFTRE